MGDFGRRRLAQGLASSALVDDQYSICRWLISVNTLPTGLLLRAYKFPDSQVQPGDNKGGRSGRSNGKVATFSALKRPKIANFRCPWKRCAPYMEDFSGTRSARKTPSAWRAGQGRTRRTPQDVDFSGARCTLISHTLEVVLEREPGSGSFQLSAYGFIAPTRRLTCDAAR